ncbi:MULTISPECIES: glycosyltransferase family 4 protein [unclassified Prevotella]|uniref:glycosyltransferase family 4 protein n=1 Tax=unclassified Prevotella TaxID=2638335 RepID=UPI000CE9E5CF|nr:MULTISPECIES: MraY family glycosyltransferase [unclassified Prevotella]MCX4293159.1 MraY family glycosyltransferase [Prevotella sp.]NPD54158.1 undecaprenyl/decaprenyl-phosphate alpha-N-acetylglucosaminyl 1-phosphate transferase [Prevotella sp. PTAC]
MNRYILYILGSFFVSFICGVVFIPIINRFCKKRKLYDLPGVRKIHKTGIPRLGGISFLPSMIAAFFLAMSVFNTVGTNGQITISLWSCFFFVSMIIIYTVGFVDDVLGLNARTKFIFQIIAASILPLSGLYINDLYGLFGIHDIPFFIGAPFTVLTIVFINNAINLIDGIDGLSAGLSLIALMGFLVYFMLGGIWVYSILIAGLMGVLISFLYFNIFGTTEKGTKIFMGDSGSLTLGFILSFLLVKLSMKNPDVITLPHNNLLLAGSLLIVPIFDVFRITFVRLKHGKAIFDADKNHIHHKIMRTGMSQHNALILILGLACFYIILNISAYNYLDFSMILITDIMIWVLFHLTINHYIKKKGGEVFYIEKEYDDN